MTEYAYDKDLPFVVEITHLQLIVARFSNDEDAAEFAKDDDGLRVIDTRPHAPLTRVEAVQALPLGTVFDLFNPVGTVTSGRYAYVKVSDDTLVQVYTYDDKLHLYSVPIDANHLGNGNAEPGFPFIITPKEL